MKYIGKLLRGKTTKSIYFVSCYDQKDDRYELMIVQVGEPANPNHYIGKLYYTPPAYVLDDFELVQS